MFLSPSDDGLISCARERFKTLITITEDQADLIFSDANISHHGRTRICDGEPRVIFQVESDSRFVVRNKM